MKETLSIKLFKTLLRGKEQLSEEALKRITHFVLSQRLEEGAFMDKSGRPDLYYTMFGRMLSYVLGIPSDKHYSYPANLDIDNLDLIHYAAYIRCLMIQRLIDEGKMKLLLKSIFSTDIKALHEFNGVPHNDMRSPYTQFIWLSLLEDVQGLRFNVQGSKFKVQSSSFKDSNEVKTLNIEPETLNFKPETLNFELSPYRGDNGGYKNTTDGLSATTNATVAVLSIKGQLEGYRDNPDLHFLYNLQQSSGGFGAAEASPLPDLLSTATSLFMLSCYGMEPKYPARDFIEGHWLDSGGFSATILEDKSDVEYTFYGLLALGSLKGSKFKVQSSRFKVQGSG